MMLKKGASLGLLVLYLAIPSIATVYTVGDSSGWTLGVDYGTWSASKTFVVGDSLVFNYGSGHTVDEVKQNDYTTCTIGNPINTDNKGNTKILLQTPGPHYFICGVIGHCASGMKLSVNILASSGSTAPTANTTTSSPTGLCPTTYPTTTTANPVMIPDYSVVSSGCRFSLHIILATFEVVFVIISSLI
ncbi:hypothetical protein vseg_004293 [Gypsophila vaccaria]